MQEQLVAQLLYTKRHRNLQRLPGCLSRHTAVTLSCFQLRQDTMLLLKNRIAAMMHPNLIAFIMMFAALTCVSAYDNGLASVPPMGWNTWCTDDICGSHTVCSSFFRSLSPSGLIDRCYAHEIKSVADAIVDQGLDQFGYQYVNMDDCWSSTSRDSTGQLQVRSRAEHRVFFRL
jgi:hypothetical protein